MYNPIRSVAQSLLTLRSVAQSLTPIQKPHELRINTLAKKPSQSFGELNFDGPVPYLWLVGNGRMVVIVVIIVPHSSIPY